MYCDVVSLQCFDSVACATGKVFNARPVKYITAILKVSLL